MAEAATRDRRTVATGAAPISAAAIERSMLMDIARGELIFVRHGQQAYPEAPRTRADLIDPPLSSVGRAQAELVARYLRSEPAAAVYCSEMQRARDTAELITREMPGDLQPVVVENLYELDLYGELPRDASAVELAERAVVDAAAELFLKTRRWESFPFTETGDALRRRVTDAIVPLARSHQGAVIVIVAHGAVMNAFLGGLLGVETDMFFFPAHGSVSRIYFNEDVWIVGTLNEVAHLRGSDPSLVTF